MRASYQELFEKSKDIEKQIICDIVNGSLRPTEIPEAFLTQMVVLNMVVASDGAITNVPFSKLDNRICLAACQLNSSNLLKIPQERSPWVSSAMSEPYLKVIDAQFKSKYICRIFVKLDHNNVKYLPDSLLGDREFIKQLCGINPRILSVMDFDSFDMELCQTALQSESFSLDCIPLNWRTKEICLEAFSNNHKDLLRFPTQFINVDLVKKAIRLCAPDLVSGYLKLIDPELFDDDLILTCVQKNESTFSLVPYTKISNDLVFNLAPFIFKHETLHHVPEDVFNVNLAHRLIACNPMLLYGVPLKHRTKSLCLEAINVNGMALGAVPTVLKNDDLYRAAIGNNGLALKFVPTPYRDAEIPVIAVEQNGEAIEFVPDSEIDEVLCRKAVVKNPHAIYSVPKKHLNNELYMLAMRHLPFVLKLIPSDLRTVDQCLLALEGDKSMYDYIPMQLRDNQRVVRLAIRLGVVSGDVENIL